MRIVEHLGKISWSLADKLVMIIFGFVTLKQISLMASAEYGLFGILIAVHSWIFLLGDSLALQNIIQFGTHVEQRGKVNLVALFYQSLITLGPSLLVFLCKDYIAYGLNNTGWITIGASLPLLTLLNIPRTFSLKLAYRDNDMRKVFFINLIYFGIISVQTLIIASKSDAMYFSDLYWMYVIGTAASSVIAIVLTGRQYKFSTAGELTVRKMFAFSVPNCMASTVHSVPRQLDVVVVTYFFGLGTAGVYNAAKTLFRVFEETVNAGSALTYPAAVRQIQRNDTKSLYDMMTKSVSLIFLVFLFTAIALNLGLSDFFIRTFLTTKYVAAIGLFNIMCISAIAYSFNILSGLIIANNDPKKILAYAMYSSLIWFAVFLFVGMMKIEGAIALPQAAYYISMASFLYVYSKKSIGYKINTIFRSVTDAISFAKSTLKLK